MEPGLFQECDSLVRNLQWRLEILAVSVHAEGDTSMDHYGEHDDMALQTHKPLLPADETEPKHLTDTVDELSKKLQKQEMGTTGNIKEKEENKRRELSAVLATRSLGKLSNIESIVRVIGTNTTLNVRLLNFLLLLLKNACLRLTWTTLKQI